MVQTCDPAGGAVNASIPQLIFGENVEIHGSLCRTSGKSFASYPVQNVASPAQWYLTNRSYSHHRRHRQEIRKGARGEDPHPPNHQSRIYIERSGSLCCPPVSAGLGERFVFPLLYFVTRNGILVDKCQKKNRVLLESTLNQSFVPSRLIKKNCEMKRVLDDIDD